MIVRSTLCAIGLLIVLMLSAIAGPQKGAEDMSATKYANFPPPLAERPPEERCQAQPDAGQIEKYQDEVLARLLSDDHRPATSDAIFYTILVDSEDRSGHSFLTFGEERNRCLLLFSSAIRANYYAAEILGRDRLVQTILYTAEELSSNVDALAASGISSITVDKCPACTQFTVVPIEELKRTKAAIDIWGIFSSTRITMADLMLEDARRLKDSGETKAAISVCLDALECVDMDRPDILLFLGECAVSSDDKVLAEGVANYLTMFDSVWMDRFKESMAAWR